MNTNFTGHVRPLLGAVAASVLALLVAFGFARELRASAMKSTAYSPEPDQWLGNTVVFSSAQTSRGRTLFGQSCAHCHADDASGDEGPDLRGIQISDRMIARTIRRGIKGEMPSFAKKHNDADIAALLAYLRSLPAEAP